MSQAQKSASGGHAQSSKVKAKNRSFSFGKLASYTGAFLLLVSVVAVGYESPQRANGQVESVSTEAAGQINSTAANNLSQPSVDQVVATNVAADLAERTNLPVAANVANMSSSLTAKSELVQREDTTTIAKPQIITPESSNRAIQYYTTKKGDTVPEISKRFGVSADTVRWANNLGDTDAVKKDKKLKILPVTGVLYEVKSGDTVSSVAKEYKASANRIVTFNDLEIDGFKKGDSVIIPGGVKPSPAARPSSSGSSSLGSTPQTSAIGTGNGIIQANLTASVGNKYAAGNCTWYVYERRAELGMPVGSYWGNANTWASNAQAAGYDVNRTPRAGAVLADQAGFYGHVAVVERVKSNGDVVITEMNNYAYGGFNIVNGRTISSGQAKAYLYIH